MTRLPIPSCPLLSVGSSSLHSVASHPHLLRGGRLSRKGEGAGAALPVLLDRKPLCWPKKDEEAGPDPGSAEGSWLDRGLLSEELGAAPSHPWPILFSLACGYARSTFPQGTEHASLKTCLLPPSLHGRGSKPPQATNTLSCPTSFQAGAPVGVQAVQPACWDGPVPTSSPPAPSSSSSPPTWERGWGGSLGASEGIFKM